MFLSDFSIRRPVATIALILALMGFGIFALTKLPVNQSPDVLQPTIVLTITYPGASPETVEREVVQRIEESIQSIPGVTAMNSTASEGSASFDIKFDYKKNMVEASDEVRNAIRAVRYKLPTEMREPVLQRLEIGARPMMELSISSTTLNLGDLSYLVESQLTEKLRAVEGVALVRVSGALRRELSILLLAERLREFNVSVTDVIEAVRAQNATAPVGKVRGTLNDQSIRLVGRIESPSAFEQIVIKRHGKEWVRLGQVAKIEDGFAEMDSLSLRNAQPNIGISVVRTREASTIATARKLHAKINELNKTFPKGTAIVITEDGGEEAQSNLDNVIESLLFGALLTILVVYVFLNSWRSTLITALSLPTSALAAFIVVWMFGFTLNGMTMLGLSLAVGVLIDDAIVVRENIVRHMELGVDRRIAASIGTKEIGLAVIATTFSVVVVFVPVAFMPGRSGEWFRAFAVTVASSVLVSLFISFTLDPMLSAYWGDPIGAQAKPKRGLTRWLEKFNTWFDSYGDNYRNVIAWALHHKILVALIAVASLVGAWHLQDRYLGSEFQPSWDGGLVIVNVRTPSSSSLEYTRLKMEHAATLARSIPETVSTNSTINIGGGTIVVDIGKVATRKRSAADITVELRQKLGRLIGAEYTVQDDLNDTSKPVQIQFFGPDSGRLMTIASAFMEQLKKVKGAVDVGLSAEDPKDELQIELNRGLANSLGISANDAAQALRVAFAGIEVGDWIDPTGKSRNVSVRLHPSDRISVKNIEHLPIAISDSNKLVPLEQIATITMGKGQAKIQHINGTRMIAVAANAQGRAAGEVTADALKLAHSIDFPTGYGLELGGASRRQSDFFTDMSWALAAGVGLMYLVLVIQFGSFTTPFAIILSLPLSLIGVVLGLIIAKCTLNLISYIGIIMLMGLVAKNAILLIDSVIQQQLLGDSRKDALMTAGRKRLRPIIMTTFALIAGMMPIAIGFREGSEFFRPMAVAIIGGTITSTLLTLLVVPTFYDAIEELRLEAISNFKQRAARWNGFWAFGITFLEVLLAIIYIRLIYRSLWKLFNLVTGRAAKSV